MILRRRQVDAGLVQNLQHKQRSRTISRLFMYDAHESTPIDTVLCTVFPSEMYADFGADLHQVNVPHHRPGGLDLTTGFLGWNASC